VLLHFEQVSFPNIPEARPPLQAGQSWSGRWHFAQVMVNTFRWNRGERWQLEDEIRGDASLTSTHIFQYPCH